MPQTIRLTITPEIEKALEVLRKATMGTLNTTEIIKMAVGELADQKTMRFSEMNTQRTSYKDIKPEDWNKISAHQLFGWAKEDGSLEADNISSNAKLKPFTPKPYVSNR